jgi:hypothetical protein
LARRSLKPQLNQIRTWVRQGRTDAWIAHQLDVSVGTSARSSASTSSRRPTAGDGELRARREPTSRTLRAEDDALVAEALEAERQAERRTDEDADEAGDEARRRRRGRRRQPKRRRRGRRGGRGRSARRKPKALEGTFDHGEEGYGLWLDPAVQDDPTYAEALGRATAR